MSGGVQLALVGLVSGGVVLACVAYAVWFTGQPAAVRRRRLAMESWVGLSGLNQRELELAVRWRYQDRVSAEDVHHRLAARRATAELLRRRSAPGGRSSATRAARRRRRQR